MNYRHKLLNQQIKRDYVPLKTYQQEVEELKKARAQDLIDTLQKDLGIDFLLDYSEIVKKLKGKSVEEVIEKLTEQEKKVKEIQDLLDRTVEILGKSDIKSLTDLTNLLQGKSLKELATEKELLTGKIKAQDTALINLAKQKIKGKKEAEHLINILETDFSKKQIEWETERENIKKEREKEREQWASELAKSREIISQLEKDKKDLLQQNKEIGFSQDKLQKEKDKLVLEKNE